MLYIKFMQKKWIIKINLKMINKWVIKKIKNKNKNEGYIGDLL